MNVALLQTKVYRQFSGSPLSVVPPAKIVQTQTPGLGLCASDPLAIPAQKPNHIGGAEGVGAAAESQFLFTFQARLEVQSGRLSCITLNL